MMSCPERSYHDLPYLSQYDKQGAGSNLDLDDWMSSPRTTLT